MYHYSQPESLSFCIALAVCQKNIEQAYMPDVNAAISTSSEKISHKFSSQSKKVKLKNKEKKVPLFK